METKASPVHLNLVLVQACLTHWRRKCLYLIGPIRDSHPFLVFTVEVTFCSLLLWGWSGRIVVMKGERLGKGGGSTICDPCCRVFRPRTHFIYLDNFSTVL